jgi:hypothetical protein
MRALLADLFDARVRSLSNYRVLRSYGFVTMSSKPSLFKQIDVKRAFEAAQLAGIEVASVDIDRSGKISIVPKSKTAGGEPAPKKEPAGAEVEPEPCD